VCNTAAFRRGTTVQYFNSALDHGLPNWAHNKTGCVFCVLTVMISNLLLGPELGLLKHITCGGIFILSNSCHQHISSVGVCYFITSPSADCIIIIVIDEALTHVGKGRLGSVQPNLALLPE
jgi:hypothetical protein